MNEMLSAWLQPDDLSRSKPAQIKPGSP